MPSFHGSLRHYPSRAIADRLQHPSKPHNGTQFDFMTEGVVMSDRSSALVEISKLNGDFRIAKMGRS
jgi:hypothetical protein